MRFKYLELVKEPRLTTRFVDYVNILTPAMADASLINNLCGVPYPLFIRDGYGVVRCSAREHEIWSLESKPGTEAATAVR